MGIKSWETVTVTQLSLWFQDTDAHTHTVSNVQTNGKFSDWQTCHGNWICKNKEENKPESNHLVNSWGLYFNLYVQYKCCWEYAATRQNNKCDSLSTISSLRSINYSVNVHAFTSVISVLFNSCKWVFILTHFDKTHLQSSSQSYWGYHLAYTTHRNVNS